MKREYSEAIASKIEEHLANGDWNFDFDSDSGFFKFNLSIHCKLKKLNYLIGVNEDSYTVYAISLIGADEDDGSMMHEMTEFICRANYGLKNGNFEMDMNDGEIRYRTFVDCNDLMPSFSVIENSILIPAAMFTRYGNGITDIIFNGATAKDAIDNCEE